MLELKLIKELKEIKIPESLKEDKQIIFYLLDSNDKSKFFIIISIFDMLNSKIEQYKCYLPENIEIVKKSINNKIYKNDKKPHSIINIESRKSFLCFMEDEEFFFYININDLCIKVYRLNDLLGENSKYKRLISTVYDCEKDSNYFYLGAVNDNEKLHLYRMNKNLKEFTYLTELDSNKYPPHVVRNIGNKLFLSHEFKYSKYKLNLSNRIINNDELASIIEIAKLRAGEKIISNTTYMKVNKKHDIKCLPGEIMSLDLNNFNIEKYTTCGGSPAHFELDSKKEFLYTSSHNFLPLENDVLYLEPAVIDKYRFTKNHNLIHLDTFSVPYGYRYTSHKVGKYNGLNYIVVFGEPNRLIFINADTMKLIFYKDIGKSYLNDNYVRDLIQSNNKIFSHLSVGIVGNGRYVCFLSQERIHFLDMKTKEITYEENILGVSNNIVLFTSHLDII